MSRTLKTLTLRCNTKSVLFKQVSLAWILTTRTSNGRPRWPSRQGGAGLITLDGLLLLFGQVCGFPFLVPARPG